jgi:plastocyanin
MNRNRIQMHRTAKSIALFVALFATASVANATTHVIQFGGAHGLTYSPSSLNVSVGDTIKWEGDFGMHPLSSTSVPAGAATFHSGSGSSFSYKVAVSGTYQYHCDFHFGAGMAGSFVATGTGIEENQTSVTPGAFMMEQNYPNPFNSSTVIRFTLPGTQQAELKLYSVTGKEIATLVDGIVPAGGYAVPVDGSLLPSGIYFFKLVTEGFSETKRMVLIK